MREFTKTSLGIAEVRGASPRAFSSRVTAEARYRKATETRFSYLSKKKAAQGFLNAAVEKVVGVATNRNVKVIHALAEKWG